MLPYNFIVDRCWFDGGGDSSEVNSGIRIAADYVSVVDSYIAEFRRIGVGVDATAISVYKGRGPYAFINNTMVATTENFFLGGATAAEINTGTVSNPTTTSATLSSVTNLEVDQNIALKTGGSYNARNSTIVRSISGNNITFDAIPTAPDNGSVAEWAVTPSFTEFRRNYLYKPLRWRPSDPSWNGINYQLKNLWETKISRYTVVDGNVMENQWISAQTYSVVLTVRNRSGGESAASVVREMQFSNNIFRNVSNGFSISQSDEGTDQGNISQRTSDITLRNNLFVNLGYNWDSSCCTHVMINLGEAPVPSNRNPLRRIFLIHNTQDDGGNPQTSGGNFITDFGSDGGALESMWVNNVHPHGGAGFRDNFTGGLTPDIAATIRRFLPPGGPSVWNRNMIVNKGSALYPANGIYITGSWQKQFVDYVGGDFTLVPGNPGKGAATDGTDVGAVIVGMYCP
jgi:hypothetical protein